MEAKQARPGSRDRKGYHGKEGYEGNLLVVFGRTHQLQAAVQHLEHGKRADVYGTVEEHVADCAQKLRPGQDIPVDEHPEGVHEAEGNQRNHQVNQPEPVLVPVRINQRGEQKNRHDDNAELIQQRIIECRCPRRQIHCTASLPSPSSIYENAGKVY